MVTRAKFVVQQIVKSIGFVGHDASGAPKMNEIDTVHLIPVYAGANASAEDKAFWEASPSGKIELGCCSPEAVKMFSPGRKIYVTFEEAPQ
jgi:hypothetical protein